MPGTDSRAHRVGAIVVVGFACVLVSAAIVVALLKRSLFPFGGGTGISGRNRWFGLWADDAPHTFSFSGKCVQFARRLQPSSSAAEKERKETRVAVKEAREEKKREEREREKSSFEL